MVYCGHCMKYKHLPHAYVYIHIQGMIPHPWFPNKLSIFADFVLKLFCLFVCFDQQPTIFWQSFQTDPCVSSREQWPVLALHRCKSEHELFFICKLSSAGVCTAEPRTVWNFTLKQGITGIWRAPRLPKQNAKGLASLLNNGHQASSALLPHLQLFLPMPTFAYKQDNPSKSIFTT